MDQSNQKTLNFETARQELAAFRREYVKIYGPVYVGTDMCAAWRRSYPGCMTSDRCAHRPGCLAYIEALKKHFRKGR